jgi:16S rRNA (uracil1498-N3)-methyltransferase
MKQFILQEYPGKNGDIHLNGKDFHYLVRVRRMRENDTINCRLPSGETAVLRVTAIEKGALIAQCIPAGETFPQNVFPPIILFQSMVKGAKMDLIVRQAGETGITEIVPFYSEHSVPRRGKNSRMDGGGETGIERLGRWRRILNEARQQSGSTIDSKVKAPQSRAQLFKYWEQIKSGHEETLALLVHEIPLVKGSFHEYLRTIPELVILAVGPEGGFSPDEASSFIETGFRPVALGDTILRAESAAIYSTAIVRTLIFERQTWTTMKN